MRITFLFVGSLIALILTLLTSACGDQSTSVPASGATPRSTLTVIAIPATYDTRTVRVPPTATATAGPALTPPATAPTLTPAAATPVVTTAGTKPQTNQASVKEAVSSTTQPASHGGPVQDYVSLIDNLRKLGATVNPVGDVTQPFFTAKGQVIKVNGEEVQIFEYSGADAAKAEASKISPDGSAIGTSMASWMSNPHFFQKERLIGLYVNNRQLKQTACPSPEGGDDRPID